MITQFKQALIDLEISAIQQEISTSKYYFIKSLI